MASSPIRLYQLPVGFTMEVGRANRALSGVILAGGQALVARMLDVLARLTDDLIVGTTNNYAPISISIKKAAQALIKKGQVISEGLLNRVEMAFRSYDPCFGCATHTLPGQMPLEVLVRDAEGNVVERLTQFVE